MHHLPHSLRVGKPVAGHHRVVYMLVECIDIHVGHTCHSPLGQKCIGLFKSGFADKGHTPIGRHFQGETHPGYAGAYHKIIKPVSHRFTTMQ